MPNPPNDSGNERASSAQLYTLLDGRGQPYRSVTPGQFSTTRRWRSLGLSGSRRPRRSSTEKSAGRRDHDVALLRLTIVLRTVVPGCDKEGVGCGTWNSSTVGGGKLAAGNGQVTDGAE